MQFFPFNRAVWREFRPILRLAGFLLALAALPLAVYASQVNLSQGFHVDGSVVEGSLVETDPAASNSVVPATVDRADQLVGVVVAGNESLLSVTSANGQTQVATSGVANALVDDINGSVKAGDRITASPIRGVGMKAISSGKIIGIAQSDLANASDIQSVQVKNNAGAPVSAKVGHITVLVNIGYYSGETSNNKTIVPGALQELSNSIAGKPVSALRIAMSTLLLLVALLVSMSLVYSAVRSSIVSIGRNPLSQPAVRRGLMQVLGFVAIILLVTLISIYLVLSR